MDNLRTLFKAAQEKERRKDLETKENHQQLKRGSKQPQNLFRVCICINTIKKQIKS